MDTATAPSIPARPAAQPFGAKRVLLLVVGSLALLLAVASLAAGGAAVWAIGERDDAGYLTTADHSFTTGGYALATGPFEISDTPSWLGDRFATLRIETASATSVFVGIGPTSEVDRYLAGVQHSQI